VAAAVLACRARPVDGVTTPPRRTRPTSAWVLLAAVAPELAEWAAFFAAGAAKRAAAEAGLPSAVTPREADDLVRDVEAFLAMVEGSLGLPAAQLLLASG
jgi:L-fucose isomerase-like protein